MGNGSYQLTSAGRSANHGQIGRHWLAGNSYFPCGRIFMFCFSEPLGINSEVLNSLLLGQGLFIQICFGGLWKLLYEMCRVHFLLLTFICLQLTSQYAKIPRLLPPRAKVECLEWIKSSRILGGLLAFLALLLPHNDSLL